MTGALTTSKPYQDKGEVLAAEPVRLLEVTHCSPLTGDEDVPESEDALRYELVQAGSGTAVSLTQDGCEREERAA